MKFLAFIIATTYLAVSLIWFASISVVSAQPQPQQQQQKQVLSPPLSSPIISSSVSTPNLSKTVSVTLNSTTSSTESPPIKTTLAVAPASWRGVCASGPTDNLRYIVKAENGTMQTVLLVEKAVYDKIATRPGLLVSGSIIERWTPLSCKEHELMSCAQDSNIDKGVTPLPKKQWCIITSNPAKAARPVMVEFNVGWSANEGPDVISVMASANGKPNEEIPQPVNSGIDRIIDGQPFYLALSTCIIVVSTLIVQSIAF